MRSLTLDRVPGSEDEGGGFTLSKSDDRYEHIRLIGRGGMGQVDQVWDHDLMRKLAVKRLHPERAERDLALRQFLWEARVTAYLDHPNIVPVHDLGIDPEGDLYFTMKFVHGTSLDELIGALARVKEATAEGRMPEVVDEVISAEHLTQLRRLRLFLDLCQAIAYAHERGVLHRDLKPANVMLGQYGEVIIMDWGLAYPLPGPAGEGLRELLPPQLHHRGTPKTPTGTPRYMSPEQVSGQELDARTDVYALGVILYELLALRSPYEATDFTRLMLQVSEGEILALPESARVPTTLAAVVTRAMALDPDQRYASVAELIDDVESVLDGVVSSPSASSTTIQLIEDEDEEPLRDPRPTVPALVWAGIGAALALALASVLSSIFAKLSWWGFGGFMVIAVVLAYLARALVMTSSSPRD